MYWTVSDIIRYAGKRNLIGPADVRGFVEFVMNSNLNYNKDIERQIYQIIGMIDDGVYYKEEAWGLIADILGYR